MNYLLHGLDDLLENNSTRMGDILDPHKSDILCMGTGFEDVCNYQCIYCYAGDVEKKKNCDMMNFDEYVKIFNEAHECGCNTIILTGALSQAEPLISKKLVPAVKKLKELDILPVVFTNLSVIGDDKLCQKIHGMTGDKLAEILYTCNASLIASIDSIDEEVYNTIVARKDSFASLKIAEKRLADVGYFKPYKIVGDTVYTRICISTVVMKNNYDSLDEMRAYWHEINCQYVCKFPSIMGNVLKNEEFFYSADEANSLKGKIEQCRDKSQTLSLVADNKKYCLMNQLGIALDSRGIPLTCLSGSTAFNDDLNFNAKTTRLKDIILRKKSKYSLEAGACPKKVKFYQKMAMN